MSYNDSPREIHNDKQNDKKYLHNVKCMEMNIQNYEYLYQFLKIDQNCLPKSSGWANSCLLGYLSF